MRFDDSREIYQSRSALPLFYVLRYDKIWYQSVLSVKQWISSSGDHLKLLPIMFLNCKYKCGIRAEVMSTKAYFHMGIP